MLLSHRKVQLIEGVENESCYRSLRADFHDRHIVRGQQRDSDRVQQWKIQGRTELLRHVRR